MMRDRHWINIVIMLVAVFVITNPLKAQSKSVIPADTDSSARQVMVSGEAEIRIVPDEVIINLGVENRDRNLHKAKRDNDAAVRKVLSAIREYDIPPEHVQTDYIFIDRRYYEDEYVVRKSIVVTLRDLDIFEDLLTDALNAGANQIHGIQFRTTELRTYRDQARALAIQAAHEKAVAMAGSLDQKVGEPQMIREEGIQWFSGYSRWWGGMNGSMTQNVIQDIGGGTWELSSDGDDSIAPGQIAIKAKVAVNFALVSR